MNPATNQKADTIQTTADGALAAGGGSVWHASSVTQSIHRLDLSPDAGSPRSRSEWSPST